MPKILVICVLCLSLAVAYRVRAEERTLAENLRPELIGRVYIDTKHGLFTPHVRQEIDKCVAKLKGKYTHEMIRIEGSYHYSADKNSNINRSLTIAREVERYLRLHHKLRLNLCIATDDGGATKDVRSSVAIYVCPGKFAEKKI